MARDTQFRRLDIIRHGGPYHFMVRRKKIASVPDKVLNKLGIYGTLAYTQVWRL
jgi:hypothetical protein